MSSLSETFFAYLAGLIDGDGCFQFVKHKNLRNKRGYTWDTLLSIGQGNREFLESLRREIGFGMINECGRRRTYGMMINQGHRCSYRLQFTSGYVRQLLPRILPFLRRKRKEALLLKEALSLLGHKGMKHHYDTDERLEQIFKEVRSLHRQRSHTLRKW